MVDLCIDIGFSHGMERVRKTRHLVTVEKAGMGELIFEIERRLREGLYMQRLSKN